MNPDSRIAVQRVRSQHSRNNTGRLPLELLRQFNAHETFPTNDGIEDKLELILGRWRVEYDANGKGWVDFKSRLEGPAQGETKSAFELDGKKGTRQSQLFCRSKSKGKDSNKLKFKTGNLRWVSGNQSLMPLLFGGSLNFSKSKERADFDDERHERELYLNLSVNLQRFIRHQPLKASPSAEKRSKLMPPVSLRERHDSRKDFGDECSYNRDDNWIPNTLNWRRFARTSEYEFHLRACIQAIVDCVTEDIRRAARHTPKKLAVKSSKFQRYHAIRVIETAWEFASENSIEDVLHWGNRFLNLAKKAGRAHLNRVGTTGRKLNSPCYEIPLKGGAKLRLYAKTNKRVRFEVVLNNVPKVRTVLLNSIGVEPHPQDEPGGTVNYRPDEELFDTVRAARHNASLLLNELMEEYRTAYGHSTRPFSAAEFLAAVASAAPPKMPSDERESLLRKLIPMLIQHQGYFAAVPSGSLGATLERLKKLGVLVYDSKRQFYKIGEKYRGAVNALHSITNATSLAVLGTERGTKPIRDR